MSEELKPCPFCGNELEKTQYKLNPTARCVTPDCRGGKMPAVTLDSPQDLEAWNTRHISEGFALVPVEPTQQQKHAAESEIANWCSSSRQSRHHQIADRVYRTMIAAAQAQPE